MSNPDGSFNVEAIVGHEVVNGYFRYMVRWTGYTDDYNLSMSADALQDSQELLQDYRKVHHILHDHVATNTRLQRTHTRRRPTNVSVLANMWQAYSGDVRGDLPLRPLRPPGGTLQAGRPPGGTLPSR